MTRADVAALATACKLRVIAIDRTPTHWLISVESIRIDARTLATKWSKAQDAAGLPQSGLTWGTLPADGYDLLRIGDME